MHLHQAGRGHRTRHCCCRRGCRPRGDDQVAAVAVAAGEEAVAVEVQAIPTEAIAVVDVEGEATVVVEVVGGAPSGDSAEMLLEGLQQRP